MDRLTTLKWLAADEEAVLARFGRWLCSATLVEEEDVDGTVESQLDDEWRAHAGAHVRSTLATYSSW